MREDVKELAQDIQRLRKMDFSQTDHDGVARVVIPVLETVLNCIENLAEELELAELRMKKLAGGDA